MDDKKRGEIDEDVFEDGICLAGFDGLMKEFSILFDFIDMSMNNKIYYYDLLLLILWDLTPVR